MELKKTIARDHFTDYLKKEFILNNYLFITIVLLLFTIYFYFLAHLFFHTLLCFSFLCVFVVLYLFAKNGRINYLMLVHFQNFFFLTVITFAFFISGGLRAPAVFWIPLVSYSTLNLIGRRAMLSWLAIGLVIATVVFVLELRGVKFDNLQSESNRHILHYIHLVLLSLYTLSISLLSEKTSRAYASNQVKLMEGMYHQNRLGSIGEIVAGVSHEINNPLAIAHGNVARLKKLLDKESISDKKIFATMENIEIANTRIMQIVKSLKTFYRKEESEDGVTDLKVLFDETKKLVQNEYISDNIKMTFPENIPATCIIGNHTRIQQVLFNLLSNSRDALDGKDNKEIVIAIQTQANNVILTVKDNGCGIPLSVKDKVLNPFFTTKEVNKGTGLGLSIIHNIIKSVGGDISIDSLEGVGTTIRVTLNSV